MVKRRLMLLVAVGLPVAAWAEPAEPMAAIQPAQGLVSAAPTAAEAEAAFQAARDAYRAVAAGAPNAQPGELEEVVTPTTVAVPGGRPENVPLDEIKLVIDVENATLRQVVTDVVAQAAQYSGPWRVKWRLKPENMGLLDEQVNLTAEAPFGEFFGLLSERVKNLTGTQLFVTVFGGARVILVADTYY
ncbi:MAG: hypothetical protein INF43_03875 [Alphaproteobacteria bacterium]|nr:hypothetical protein [Alphaproteobacteria bacterium]